MEQGGSDGGELRGELRLAARVLAEVVREQEGPELAGLVEELRRAVVRLRGRSDPALERRLAARLRRLPIAQLVAAARAFTVLSTLANVCETRHEVRTRRLAEAPFERLLRRLRRHGVTREAIEQTAADLAVTVVFTAHPTETTRWTVQRLLERVEALLERLRGDAGRRARGGGAGRPRSRPLWQASFLQHRAPTPIDEVLHLLHTLETVLFTAVPRVQQRLRATRRAASTASSARPSARWCGSARGSAAIATATRTSRPSSPPRRCGSTGARCSSATARRSPS